MIEKLEPNSDAWWEARRHDWPGPELFPDLFILSEADREALRPAPEWRPLEDPAIAEQVRAISDMCAQTLWSGTALFKGLIELLRFLPTARKEKV